MKNQGRTKLGETFSRLLVSTSLLFLLASLTSCSYLISPFSPLAANIEMMKYEAKLKSTSPKSIVIEPQQLASVQNIAVMPLTNLSVPRGGEDLGLALYKKDIAVSFTLLLPGDLTGELISEYIEENLLRRHTVNIVERSRLNLILQEQALMQKGIAGYDIPEIVAATAGAEAILIGKIVSGYMVLPERVPLLSALGIHIKLKLVDTRTGKILMYVSDRQYIATLNPNETTVVFDRIGERCAKVISDALVKSRQDYPDAKLPTKAEFLKNYSSK